MTKVRCKHCKELPASWRGGYSDAGWWGLRCSNCDCVRPIKRRASPVRDARNARLNALINELLEK